MRLLLSTCLLASAISLHAQSAADLAWGDLGDGTFANPVLNADYSDPDVIRVGDKYYMTCSEFHFMGIPILESTDLVNWKLIARVYDSMDGYDDMNRYGDGSWAPAIRHHDGRFFIYFCTPNDGLFMTSAINPEGPWEPLHHVKKVSGWEDPCPLWDADGNAYLGRSALGGGPIILHRMSPDGKTLLDDGIEIYHGPVAEGTKLFIKDGKYYLNIPEGGVGTGWQQIGFADNIYGPYAMRTVLEQGSTDINGPHQGALVDTPDGQWWFYHFQGTDCLGRVVHLQPVKWADDGYPRIGTDYDGNGIGEPMKIVNKPSFAKNSTPSIVATSDNFDAGLGLHWQFNHNPIPENISTDSKGRLHLAMSEAPRLREARNQLTQKLMGYSGSATVELDASQFADDSRAGLLVLGNRTFGFGIVKSPAGLIIYTEDNGNIRLLDKAAKKMWLRISYSAPDREFTPAYSFDGKKFTTLPALSNREGDWKGVRLGLFAYSPLLKSQASDKKQPEAIFDNFLYITDHIAHK